MASLYASDNRGVYIPQFFAESVNRDCVSGVSDDMWSVLEAGPDHEAYWDVWGTVTGDAVITAPDGKVGFLWQDGDLWIIWGEDDPDYENIIGEQ